MLNTVKVPNQFEPIFEKAQEYVSKYFKEKKEDPTKGTIEIFGQRYILVRAASMSVDFFDIVKELYKDKGEEEAINIARQLLFDIAHAIGKQDARNFHSRMQVKDPIEKLSAGPIHFAHSGWAFVDILPESRPSSDENYYLIYDHPFSFESDAWEKSNRKTHFPVCVMNAGYSSGWCEESFGVTLVASEIMCKAKGDDVCRFIMAHPLKIEGYIKEYLKKDPVLAKRVTSYEIPGFFKVKQIDEERKKAEEELRLKSEIMKNISEGIVFSKPDDGTIIYTNSKFEKMFGYKSGEMAGKNIAMVNASTDKNPEENARNIQKSLRETNVWKGEICNIKKDGTHFWCKASVSIFKDSKHGKIAVGVHTDITERKKMEEELKKKIHDLEIFNKIAVGRELKMMELKARIKELEEKLGEKA